MVCFLPASQSSDSTGEMIALMYSKMEKLAITIVFPAVVKGKAVGSKIMSSDTHIKAVDLFPRRCSMAVKVKQIEASTVTRDSKQVSGQRTYR